MGRMIMLVLVLQLWCGGADEIVFINQGTVLSKIGGVGAFDNWDVIVVTIQYERPRIETPDVVQVWQSMRAHTAQTQLTCLDTWAEEILSLEEELDEGENRIAEIVREVTEMGHGGLEVEPRTKRSALGATLTGAEIVYNWGKDLGRDVLSERVLHHKSTENMTVRYMEEQLQFNIKVAGVTMGFERSIRMGLVKETCLYDVLTYSYHKSKDIRNYLNHLRALMQLQIMDGILAGQLTPSIFRVETVKRIVNEHEAFSDTLYTESPMRLYKHSTIFFSKLKILNQLSEVRMILRFPILRTGCMYSLYNVYQTGFLLPNAPSCGKLVLGRQLLGKNSTLYAIDKGGFIDNNAFPIMKVEAANLEQSCLETGTCPVEVGACAEYSYHYGAGGVLVNTRSPIKVKVSHNHYIVYIKPDNEYTAYIPWNITSLIVMGSIYLESPDISQDHHILKVPLNYSKEDYDNLLHGVYIDTGDASKELKSIIVHQNKTLEKLERVLENVSPLVMRRNHWKVYSFTGLICCLLVCGIGYCCCCRWGLVRCMSTQASQSKSSVA